MISELKEDKPSVLAPGSPQKRVLLDDGILGKNVQIGPVKEVIKETETPKGLEKIMSHIYNAVSENEMVDRRFRRILHDPTL